MFSDKIKSAGPAEASKKAYQTPKLATHGNVEKLTLNGSRVGGYSDLYQGGSNGNHHHEWWKFW